MAEAYTYLFVIGLLFAFLDAYMIGANDVANSFATSIASRSLTMTQAMVIATFTEFGGAVLVGSRVTDTIRNKIVDVNKFEDEPYTLMLGMLCALIGSSTWLTIATKIGLPVSTTHSIVGGICGIGVAVFGRTGVLWGWNGVSQVFAAWVIAPGIAGIFSIIIFLITKYAVLERKNSLRNGMALIPVYFGITAGILTMVIVWKGAPNLKLDSWNAGQILGCIFGVGFGVALICIVFFIPYLHRRLVKEDWTLKWYHFFLGPLLYRRGPVPAKPEGTKAAVVQNYYAGHMTKAELEAVEQQNRMRGDTETGLDSHGGIRDMSHNSNITPVGQGLTTSEKYGNGDNMAIKGSSSTPSNSSPPASFIDPHAQPAATATKPKRSPLQWITYGITRGVKKDVVGSQSQQATGFAAKFLAGNMPVMHSKTAHYDNKTEHMYSFLQVLTAGTASFAHGSNDVSNAMGPLSAIYLVWSSGQLLSRSPVPIWVLAFGGAAIVIGLWTYGYHIMRNLGNRLTLHSPSRGFSMELGAALTVVFATRLGLPVSTTQCIVGSTVGVGLCSGDIKAVNWRMVAWIYGGWIFTLPVTGIISGLLMGIIINAPRLTTFGR